jgi:hypothetical protein
MCNPGVDCVWCGPAIEACRRVAAAFPTQAEEIDLKRSKRVINTTCTAPGCGNPKAKGSSQCLLHKRARNRRYTSRQKGAAHVE